MLYTFRGPGFEQQAAALLYFMLQSLR
jgi:hypothetical protein